MIDAGRVGFLYKYDYSPTETYEQLDVVLYDSSLWTPKQNTTGNPPPDQTEDESAPAVTENEYWQLFLPGALGRDYVKKTDIAAAPTETGSGKAGIMFPDGKTILIGEDGMISGASIDYMGTQKEAEAALASGELTEGMTLYLKDVQTLYGESTVGADKALNAIAKVENGQIVLYGLTGGESEGAPVYVFETEEEFNQANAAGEIPDGALIIKTYDEIEMAGGPFDDALDPESENAVQNKVITRALSQKANGAGITFSIEDGVLYASYDDGA